MRKFSDFRIIYMENNTCEGSVYFNKQSMLNYNRIVNYFEIYFANGIKTELDKFIYNNSDLTIYQELFSEPILRKIGTMGELVYDENNNGFNGDKKIDHEENKKLIKFIITCNLINVYYSKLVKYCSIDNAERRVERLMCEAAIYWKVDHIIDYIATRGKEKENKKENKEESKPMLKKPYNEEREYEDDYEFSRLKMKALYTAITNMNITYCHNINIKNNLLLRYRSNTMFYEKRYGYHNNQKFNVMNIIKKSIMDISLLNLDLDVKDKILKSLSKVLDDPSFDDEKLFMDMKDVLEYSEHNRPNYKCDKIVDKFKDTHSYTGKVYHGFVDRWGGSLTADNILKSYREGYISCSKDIRIARNFACMNTYSEQSSGVICSGAVLEINISEKDVAIDIEKILKDQYLNNSYLYDRLYDNYMKEKEVMLKLPCLSYNILHKDEVDRLVRQVEEEEKKANETK